MAPHHDRPDAPPRLLDRKGFVAAVFARDGRACVLCGAREADGAKLDAHHIVERRLWPDGGYYLENGATLCDPTCHMRAETTEVSAQALRERCGIARTLLPPHLDASRAYDKWGNVMLPGGGRERGELMGDPSVAKILAPFLGEFSRLVGYPRTLHLPWSAARGDDDRTMADTRAFEGREVVVTLKRDGQNTSVYGPDGYVHARSTAPLSTPDSDRMKALAAELGPDIPEGLRLVGEDMTRTHGIQYTNLAPGPRWFFELFSVWTRDNQSLDWDAVSEWAALLDLRTVPVVYRGPWSEAAVRRAGEVTHYEGDPVEGYVVRVASEYTLAEHRRVVGKFVHAGFRPGGPTEPGQKWRYARPVFNQPRSGERTPTSEHDDPTNEAPRGAGSTR